MSEWSEEDSSVYREIAGIAVPRHQEMMATLVSAVSIYATELPTCSTSTRAKILIIIMKAFQHDYT